MLADHQVRRPRLANFKKRAGACHLSTANSNQRAPTAVLQKQTKPSKQQRAVHDVVQHAAISTPRRSGPCKHSLSQRVSGHHLHTHTRSCLLKGLRNRKKTTKKVLSQSAPLRL